MLRARAACAVAVALLLLTLVAGSSAQVLPTANGAGRTCSTASGSWYNLLLWLYNNCDGATWGPSRNWGDGYCPCYYSTQTGVQTHWDGVTCRIGSYSTLEVTSIDMSGFGMSCTLPEDWHQNTYITYGIPSSFSYLETLDFSDNPNLIGSVPRVYVSNDQDFGTGLTSINLLNTGITDLNFTTSYYDTLKTLQVSGSSFTSAALATIVPTQLPALEVLDVSNGALTDLNSLISSLSGITTLRRLIASYNQMTGGLPATLKTSMAGGNGITHLYLDHNAFDGTVDPTSVQYTGNLVGYSPRILDISNNQLTGTMPTPDGTSIFVQNNNFPCPQTYTSGGMNCLCPDGHAAGTNSLSCTACLAGTATFESPPRAPSTCQACGNDTASLPAANECTYGCEAGAYLQAEFICDYCPVGKVSAANATMCDDYCPPNHVLVSTSECAPCAAGTYSNPPSLSTCTACPAGSFVNGTGAFDSCDVCPAGTYTSLSNAVACTPCDYGTYGPAGNATACLACATNTDTLGATECAPEDVSDDDDDSDDDGTGDGDEAGAQAGLTQDPVFVASAGGGAAALVAMSFGYTRRRRRLRAAKAAPKSALADSSEA